MVLFCFADGETEAQRGRSVGSRDRAGGKGRQSPGWTPAQGLDRASTAVLRWWEEGLSPTSPRPMKQDTHPGGVRGEEAWPPAGAAGLRQNPPALFSLLWTSKAAGNRKRVLGGWVVSVSRTTPLPQTCAICRMRGATWWSPQASPIPRRRLVTKSCPTLCDPVDCGPPGSSIHRIL